MHIFNYKNIANSLLTTDIINLVSAIHEFKGKQALYIEAKPDILSYMLRNAKVQSTEASNRIEGIYTSKARLDEIVENKAVPNGRNEKEIAGYRDVLATIHESYDYIPPTSNYMLQLHNILYSYSGSTIGGSFKNSDNVIEEIYTDGRRKIRFKPVSAFETPDAMDRICRAYIKESNEGKINQLLLIPAFILDFLCIHPFNDGNGRVSRLLTLLLLYRSGYIVGKYISIEKIIERSKDTYYDVLRESSLGWHTNENNYRPFIEYYLGTILNAYREFSTRVEHLSDGNIKSIDRIRKIFETKIGKITKADIVEICPDISLITIERSLSQLKNGGVITQLGNGRYTAYILRNVTD